MSLVVIGMHRSGTSLLIGLLELHRFYIGEVSTKTSPLKPTGTKEHLLVREINNEILKTTHSNWANPVTPSHISAEIEKKIRLVVSELKQNEPWALKDPRFVFTYEIWKKFLPKHQVMYCLRESDDVARSLLKKNQMETEEGLKLWFKYNKKLLDLLKEVPGPLIEFKNKSTVHSHFQKACHQLGIDFNSELLSHFYLHNDEAKKKERVETPPEHKQLYREITKLASRGAC